MNGIKESLNYVEQLNFDTPLLKCCAYYFGLFKNTQISFEELEGMTRDLNDYKNVSAIAYYSLKNNKPEVVNLLNKGLERISKKKIDSSNMLIIDDMAVFGLALIVVKLNLTSYTEWMNNIIFENNKFNYSKGNGFAIALEEYIKGIHDFSSKDMKYCAVKIWLENNVHSKNNVLELQSEFAKDVWAMGVPLFEDEFYNILSIGIIYTYINEKFKSDIVTNENKYQRALKISLLHSKIIAIFITVLITIVITVISVWFLYNIWKFEMKAAKDFIETIIKIVTQIIGVIIVPLGFYKLLPKFYKQLINIIDLIIRKFRGL